jgi:hypothetical protein
MATLEKIGDELIEDWIQVDIAAVKSSTCAEAP